eukprot:TRINITY_DN14060_c0_g1_i1.p1 TRINITY_DN14060_c0_g1~~TRINITY_DN14060_c0_g1_i1.p1  ORF type:complete len:536 (-),score=91.20 TRINITY_DN14060_c0_g1_i1:15-1622(-)
MAEEDAERKEKYIKERTSEFVSIRKIKDRKVKAKVRKIKDFQKTAVNSAAQSELLLTQEAGYLSSDNPFLPTSQIKQSDLLPHVDLQSAQKVFDYTLDKFGPYRPAYTRSGRFLVLAGAKGHLGIIDWESNKLINEFYVNEPIRDVTFLHDNTLHAAAQKKYVFVYDKAGTEIHRLRNHIDVLRLSYLPYHWLLVSVGNAGYLKYQDMSTGDLVVEHRTGLGRCIAMQQNPRNAVMHLGHANGTVTLWTPNFKTPVVKLFAHRGPVLDLSVDNSGEYMVTTGADCRMRVWDMRKNYAPVFEYCTRGSASSLRFSQTGLVAAASGREVAVWKDLCKVKQQKPYMVHRVGGVSKGEKSASVSGLEFVPFADVLGIGHTTGFSSILVPGSGEANFDAMEANPYATRKQRKEHAVHALLDKLQPDMITLDHHFVGNLAVGGLTREDKRDKEKLEVLHPGMKYDPNKKKARGKNSARRRLRVKNLNVWTNKKAEIIRSREQEKQAEQKQAKKNRKRKRKGDHPKPAGPPPSALSRFTQKQ